MNHTLKIVAMKKIFKINIILVTGFLIASISCTRDFEEINQDPNEPLEVPNTNILARALRYTGDNFYSYWQKTEMCSYAGQITNIMYPVESSYHSREGTVIALWYNSYVTLNNLKQIIIRASADGDKNMQAAAITFSCMLWQMTTDHWKAVPFSQALRGLEGITNPAYDTQDQIYYGIADTLKMAADLFAEGNGDDLGEGDLLFYGDAFKWQKFCNSLRLRVAIRMSGADPARAREIIEEVMGDPVRYPVMSGNDDNAFLWWPGTAPYREPYAEDAMENDFNGMCDVLVNTLIQYNDPRLPVYAQPAYFDEDNNPVYRGIDPGAVLNSFQLDTISRIGARFCDDPAGFTPFLRYAEVLFDIAEASFLGWNTGWNAQEAYEAGIIASMEENGITDQATLDAYLSQAGIAWNNDVRQIHLQNWICIFKEGQEAWAEVRRTDVPVIDMSKGATNPPYGTHNRQPFRYPYPTDEYNLNGANVQAVSGGIVDEFWGQQMWWDKRTGVY